VVSLLFLKDFHRESKPWSRLFKAGNNKILECMNGLKNRFFYFSQKTTKKDLFCKSGQIFEK
jgi:hypothetical protein